MKYIKHIILTAFVMVMTANAWGIQVYIHFLNGTWPTGVSLTSGNLVLEMEPSDTFENLKAKIEDKTGFNPSGMKLSYGTYDDLANNKTLAECGITQTGTTINLKYSLPHRTDTDPNSWAFKMPRGDRSLRTTWKRDPQLAWKVGEETVTVESNPLVAYVGFPFEGATLTAANDDILGEVTYSIAHKTGTNSGNTVSADGVVTINGVGIDTVKAVFAGNDTLMPDSAMYIIDTRAPYTLTLNTNDAAMGTVKIDSAGGSGEKTIIPYNSISVSACCESMNGEGCDSLFDGITSGNNKWGTQDENKYVEFQTSAAVQVNGYTLVTGDDNASSWGHGRNPKSWVLKAKLASTDSWTTVATVTNDETMQDVNYTPFDFEMDVPGTYQYFRFEVSALRGSGNFMQLGEMQLFNRAISFLDSVIVKNAAANEYYVLPGAKVAVKAIPAAGYQLLKWEDNSTDLTRTVTVTGDTTLTATFGLPTPGLTPEGELTTSGTRFLDEHGDIVGTPRLTETGVFIEAGGTPDPSYGYDTEKGLYYITVSQGSSALSGGRTFYYSQGQTYSEAAANEANKVSEDIGWFVWSNDYNQATIYYKDGNGQGDMNVDGNVNFLQGDVKLNTVIDPVNHVFTFTPPYSY